MTAPADAGHQMRADLAAYCASRGWIAPPPARRIRSALATVLLWIALTLAIALGAGVAWYMAGSSLRTDETAIPQRSGSVT